MGKVLSAKNITKSYSFPSSVEVLKGISLEVEAGSSLAILGRSGEGKSTLLHILGTLESPTSGELFIEGEKVEMKRVPFFRSHKIGFIFQAFHLIEDESLLQNVLLPAWIGGKKINKHSETHERALELIEAVGLSHRLHFPTRLLSGGEKQRVAIARALLTHPALILADEPTGNLDRANADAIIELLFSLVKKEKKALLIATHAEELAPLCDKKVILQEGMLTTTGHSCR